MSVALRNRICSEQRAGAVTDSAATCRYRYLYLCAYPHTQRAEGYLSLWIDSSNPAEISTWECQRDKLGVQAMAWSCSAPPRCSFKHQNHCHLQGFFVTYIELVSLGSSIPHNLN